MIRGGKMKQFFRTENSETKVTDSKTKARSGV